MLFGIIIVLLLGVFLCALYYGYKLAFWYEDPKASPYAYQDDAQTRSCKAVLDEAIEAFAAAPYEHVSITSHDGLTLTGKYYHTADGAPLEIHCHGYKGNAIRDFCGSWKIAAEGGRNVLLIDQRCHGGSQGHTITFGILEQKDVLAWIKWADDRFGSVPVLLCGVSMGAATVLMAAGQPLPEHVRGIIADCPYDAPSNIIKKVLGQDAGMNVKIIYPLIRMGARLYGHFDLEADSPLEAVKRARIPILLIHGADDRFVPHAMSCSIHASAPDKIEFHTIPGAGHALNYAAEPEKFARIVRSFTEKVLGTY